MKIKQDPATKLYCREDGAVLMPPTAHSRFKTFRWTFGSRQLTGYRTIWHRGKTYFIHQMVCRAFNGLPPEDRPCVDHINRIRDDNRPENLHWVDHKENSANQSKVDLVLEKYGVRQCDDQAAYSKAYIAAHREEHNARQRVYTEAHREEINARSRARWAVKAAEMKSKGFHYTKGPDGKQGWYPKACYKAQRDAFDGYEEEYAKALAKS